MSSIAALALRTTFRHARAVAAAAPRYNSTRRYTSTMHDNDPAVLAEEKARNLSNTQHKTSTPHEHAPGWNEYLASASEAHVKADGSAATPGELVEQTVRHVRARHHGEDSGVGTEAAYERDEIAGPLSGETRVYERETVEREEVHGPLKGARAREAQKEAIKKGSTGSEEAVKADRNDI